MLKKRNKKQYKNLSNDAQTQQEEQSRLDGSRISQKVPIHGIRSGEGKDSNDQNNSGGNKTVGGASAPQRGSNNYRKRRSAFNDRMQMNLHDSAGLGSASINHIAANKIGAYAAMTHL